MAIKRLNPAQPSLKRPLRVQDLQDLWDAFAQILAEPLDDDTPRILTGLTFEDDVLLAGTLAINRKLYYYDGSENIEWTESGVTMYPVEVLDTDDTRTLSDGTQIPFAYLNKLTSIRPASYSGVEVVLSSSTIQTYKTPFIGREQIKTFALGTSVVTSEKIANNAVTSEKIANNAVTTQKIGAGAVTGAKIANRTIGANNVATDALEPYNVMEAYRVSRVNGVPHDFNFNGAAPVQINIFGTDEEGLPLIQTDAHGAWITPSIRVRYTGGTSNILANINLRLTLGGSDAARAANYPQTFVIPVEFILAGTGAAQRDVEIFYALDVQSTEAAIRKISVHLEASAYAKMYLTVVRTSPTVGYEPVSLRIADDAGDSTWVDEPVTA